MSGKVSKLGHVGLFVQDADQLSRFYVDTLGMTVTDRDATKVFLSARPTEEHHELLLVTEPSSSRKSGVQQMSFVCDGLPAVADIYRRLTDQSIPIDMVVSHGNAVGVYFFDPEGNRCEVYCQTGIEARQPYLEPVDLSQPPDEILAAVRASVDSHEGGPYVDTDFVRQRKAAAR